MILYVAVYLRAPSYTCFSRAVWILENTTRPPTPPRKHGLDMLADHRAVYCCRSLQMFLRITTYHMTRSLAGTHVAYTAETLVVANGCSSYQCFLVAKLNGARGEWVVVESCSLSSFLLRRTR